MSAHQEYKWLIDLLSDMDVKIRSYSGRFMYGKNCLGIEFGGRGDTYETEYQLFGDLMEACLDANDSEDQDDIRKLAEIIKGARSDSMGLGMVVYFPRVKWEEYMYGDDGDSDEESEDDSDDEETEGGKAAQTFLKNIKQDKWSLLASSDADE